MMERMDDIAEVDITSAAFKADPFPFYRRLREEAPVWPVKLKMRRGQRVWLVTRYDDVVAVLKDPATFVKDRTMAMSPQQLARAPGVPRMFAALERNLLALDGADHGRLRALVHRAFTARTIENMRATAEQVTERALDRVEAMGNFDLVADFGVPVPLTVIGRILGVPDDDHARFGRWWRSFVEVGSGVNPLFLLPSMLRLVWYLRRLIASRRKRPEDDLVSALVLAQEGDDRLTDDEILAMTLLLLSAGHETTVNLIGSGMLALLEHPDELARLGREPERIGTTVEELLRFAGPAETATERYAMRDVEVAGTRIPKGELVLAVLASANRDPAKFDRPDALDIGRSSNRHLSFGLGLHHCLGAPLARMEGTVAIGALVARAPRLRLRVPVSRLRWRPGFVLRGLEALPVSF